MLLYYKVKKECYSLISHALKQEGEKRVQTSQGRYMLFWSMQWQQLQRPADVGISYDDTILSVITEELCVNAHCCIIRINYKIAIVDSLIGNLNNVIELYNLFETTC